MTVVPVSGSAAHVETPTCELFEHEETSQMQTPNTGNEKQLRGELQRELLSRRREFLKRAFLITAYAAPVAISFAAADLARAASCPGVGRCGKSEWAHSM